MSFDSHGRGFRDDTKLGMETKKRLLTAMDGSFGGDAKLQIEAEK